MRLDEINATDMLKRCTCIPFLPLVEGLLLHLLAAFCDTPPPDASRLSHPASLNASNPTLNLQSKRFLALTRQISSGEKVSFLAGLFKLLNLSVEVTTCATLGGTVQCATSVFSPRTSQ